MVEILMPDIMGVLDALAFEANAKGRNVRRLTGKTTDESIVARAHRAAWKIYREGPLRERFNTKQGDRWGFSQRDPQYAGTDAFRADNRKGKPGRRAGSGIRKGNLPAYVYTGRFRDAVTKRKGRVSYAPGGVSSRFTIFAGVLNTLGNSSQRGFRTLRIVEKTGTTTRAAHRRFDRRSGKFVSVRSYTQRFRRQVVVGELSRQTYAQEWSFQPWESKSVRDDVERLALEGFRKAVYSKGRLRTSIRDRMRAGAG